MEEVAKFGQALIEHGAIGYGCGLMALAIVCMNGKSLLEGASTFLTAKKRVDGEERRADKAFEEAAERRRQRRFKATQPGALSALPAPAQDAAIKQAPSTRQNKSKGSAKLRNSAEPARRPER